MKTSVIFSALFFVACGPPPVQDCEVRELGSFSGDFSFSCEKASRLFRLAQDVLVASNIVPEKDIHTFALGVSVEVKEGESLRVDPVTRVFTGNELDGLYSWPGWITLNQDGDKLLHELIHHWDVTHHTLDFNTTLNHGDWDRTILDFEGKETSKNSADTEYVRMVYAAHINLH